jgi:hypothetical protein
MEDIKKKGLGLKLSRWKPISNYVSVDYKITVTDIWGAAWWWLRRGEVMAPGK